MANNQISYYLPALQKARRDYQSHASNIENLMSRINNLVHSELAAGWQGASYDAFLAQNDTTVKAAFAKMAEALSLIASQIANAEANAIAADEASRV